MKGIFVSPEHQMQASLRTHTAYRLAAYILIICIALQIPFTLHMLKEARATGAIRQKTENALAEKTRTLSKLEPLQDVLKKIREAQSWIQTGTYKFGASEILCHLEESVSEGICLTEVTLQNKAQNLRGPDRFEVEIRGYGKTREPEAWMRSLEERFPSWNISHTHAGKLPATEDSQGLAPFSLLLQQPNNP